MVEDWKRILSSDETKSTRLDQMEGSILGRKRGNHLLTKLPLLQSSMEEGMILSYEVEWSRSAYQVLGDHICRAIL
jgi:hypothetical protein